MHRIAFVVIAASILPFTASAKQTLGPDQAEKFIGSDVMVCGKVDSARYNENSDGQPTFMHMGGSFPQHKFAVRVMGENRGRFETAPEALIGRMVCVNGTIGAATGNRPEIELSEPSKLQVL